MTDSSTDIFAAPTSDTDVAPDGGLLGVYVGDDGSEFYLPRFARFESGGSRIGWNWPAFFLNAFWLMYRKMWALAFFVWVVLPILVSIFGGALVSLGILPYVLVDLAETAILFLVYLIILPMYANSLYYEHAQSKIQQAESRFSDSDQLRAELRRIGGTSIVPYVLFGIMVTLMLGGMVLAGLGTVW